MEILDEAVGLCIRCLGDRDGGVKPASRSKLLDNPLDQRLCQVWDNSTPWKPFPRDYIVGPILFRTFDEAMARKMQLVAHRECW